MRSRRGGATAPATTQTALAAVSAHGWPASREPLISPSAATTVLTVPLRTFHKWSDWR